MLSFGLCGSGCKKLGNSKILVIASEAISKNSRILLSFKLCGSGCKKLGNSKILVIASEAKQYLGILNFIARNSRFSLRNSKFYC